MLHSCTGLGAKTLNLLTAQQHSTAAYINIWLRPRARIPHNPLCASSALPSATFAGARSYRRQDGHQHRQAVGIVCRLEGEIELKPEADELSFAIPVGSNIRHCHAYRSRHSRDRRSAWLTDEIECLGSTGGSNRGARTQSDLIYQGLAHRAPPVCQCGAPARSADAPIPSRNARVVTANDPAGVGVGKNHRLSIDIDVRAVERAAFLRTLVQREFT